jgi:hypothetical protein
MGIENLQAAHQEHGHANGVDPMRHPDPERMAIEQMERGHWLSLQAAPPNTSGHAGALQKIAIL